MNWGIRPHSIGGWLQHLGISVKEWKRIQKLYPPPARKRARGKR